MGFGVRPDRLRSVGRYADCRRRCWLSKENPPEVPHSSVSSKHFHCGHYPPTNARRSLVCRPVPIPDKLPYDQSEGTNRLQCRQGRHKYSPLISAYRHCYFHAVSTFLTGSTAEGEDTSFLSSLSSRPSPKYCACIFRIPLLRFISNRTSCSSRRCALCRIFHETTFGIYFFFVCRLILSVSSVGVPRKFFSSFMTLTIAVMISSSNCSGDTQLSAISSQRCAVLCNFSSRLSMSRPSQYSVLLLQLTYRCRVPTMTYRLSAHLREYTSPV